MKTISKDQFAEFLAGALPQLMMLIARGDTSGVSAGRVSVPQFWTMHYIHEAGQLSVNELAKRLHRSKSTTSALLSRMEKQGLVERKQNPADRRMVFILLTQKGQKLIVALDRQHKEGIYETYGVLSAEERSVYQTLIEKVLAQHRTLVLFILLSGGLFSARAAELVKTYSLDESIRIGLKRSLVVANAARQRGIAQAKQKRALSAALPQVTGLADYSLYDAENITDTGSTRAGAEASWQIFAGGRTASALRAAKVYGQLTADQERRIQAMQVRDISLSYYKVQLAKAQVAVLEESVKQLQDFEADTRKKYDAGTASEFAWLSAKVSLANENPRLIAAKNKLSLAKIEFRNLTFIDDGDFELSDPLEFTPLKVDLDKALALGLQKRPELLEKSAAINLRREDIKQQQSDYAPKVDLVAAYNFYNPDPYGFIPGSSADGWQDHWNAGIRASWSLFDGGRRRANVSESKLNMVIEEDQYIDLQRAIELEIRTHWLRGRDSAEVIAATAESIGLAKRALKIARARFDAGLGTNLEVTQANLELSDAQLARFVALYEYMNAVTGIKYAIGILLEEYVHE